MRVQVVVERDNVNDESVIVQKIYRESGARVSVDEPILEIETSKTVKEVRAPQSGFLVLSLEEGDEVEVGGQLFAVDPEGEAQAVTAPAAVASDERQDAARVLSLAAEALADELKVDRQSLPRGWITSQDVRAAAGGSSTREGARQRVGQDRPATGNAAPKAKFDPQPMPLRKRTEARNLARANGQGTTSMIGIEIPLPGERLALPPDLFEDAITDVLVFEAAKLLRTYRDLNAFYVNERTIGYFDEINVGIAFDAGHDLKVLALLAADTLSLDRVQSGIQGLLDLYESKQPIDDALLGGSTVTVSDLSRSSATFMLPLLNAEQSLLIGITRRDARHYTLHAAFDHRVSEGLQVARFLEELRLRIVSHHRPSGFGSNAATLRCSACDLALEAEAGHNRPWLVRVVLRDGSQGQLCRNCYDGW